MAPVQFWPQADPDLVRPARATRDLAWGLSDRSIKAAGNVLEEASRYLGRGNPTGTRGPWCRDFVNFILRRTGHRTDSSRLAIDALRLGPHVAHPQPGDLVVMRGHITFFAGWERGHVIGLGGNQRHRVRFSRYPLSRVVAFVRPV